MTTDLQILKEMFDSDKDIRVIGLDDDIFIPVIDIGNAVGFDHRQLIKIIDRNDETFEGFERVVITTHRENLSEFEIRQHTVRAVNEQGLYILLSKISVNRIENDTVKAKIIKFQRWVPELIKRYRLSKTVSRPMTPGEVFTDQMIFAKVLHEFNGLDKTLVTVAAINETEKLTGNELTIYKNMLPPVDGIIAVHLATDLGKFVKKDARVVNVALRELGFHVKNRSYWELTEEGKKYGKPYHETNASTGWAGIVNKWSPEVIDILKDYFH